jgi:N4-bis(aminopropyl)spermidine synthase
MPRCRTRERRVRAAGTSVMDRPHADTLIQDVAAAVALVEGEAGVRDLIALVARLEPVAVRRLSRALELPVPIVAAICGELRKRGVVAPQRPVQLSPRGRKLFGPRFPSATPSSVCPSCDGRAVVLGDELAEVAAELTKIAEAAPPARIDIDQSHCTVPTKLRRVLSLQDAGALVGRRILLLGDDDLMSVAIDRVGRRMGFAESIKELVVVDVDPAVLGFCRARLRGAPFAVTLFEHDLRAPLPQKMWDRFDTVFTDPPYTPAGAELFLSRAAGALSSRMIGQIFFCFGMKPSHEALRIQRAIAEMGLVTRSVTRNFNEYHGSGSVAGVSHLYHLTSTNVTLPLIGDKYCGSLYTGDGRRARRFRCVSCGAIQTVGPDERWKTVRELKATGCPKCGARVFRPRPRGEGERPTSWGVTLVSSKDC